MRNAKHHGRLDALVLRLAALGKMCGNLMKLLQEKAYLDVVCKLDLDSSWTHAVLPSHWVKLFVFLLSAIGNSNYGWEPTLLR